VAVHDGVGVRVPPRARWLTGAPVQALPFQNATQQAPTPPSAPAANTLTAAQVRQIGQRQIRTGLTWAAIRVLVTVITFNMTHGGTTIVAFGPVIFGVRMMFRGAKTLARSARLY
jgi:hypothetical protein